MFSSEPESPGEVFPLLSWLISSENAGFESGLIGRPCPVGEWLFSDGGLSSPIGGWPTAGRSTVGTAATIELVPTAGWFNCKQYNYMSI